MTRSKKLAPVVQHVEKNEEQALQAVAFSQRQLTLQQDRLQQLIEYKLEYAERHVNGSAQSYTAVQFQEFNRFLVQLDDTIERQKQVVSLAQHEVDVKRQKWKLTRTRSDAMHKVVGRLQDDEQKLVHKAEQKTMDELSLRFSIKTSI